MPIVEQIIDALEPGSRRLLEKETETLTLHAGTALFREGDAGDALYFVLSGSLGAYVDFDADQPRLIALIGPGETVGEMALISGERRSATIIAIRDSELLRLSTVQFNRLLKTQPHVMTSLARILVHRLRQINRNKTVAIDTKTVSFLPATESVEVENIAKDIAARIEQKGQTVKVIGAACAARSSSWFSDQEKNYSHVFFCGSWRRDDWTRRCARQSDQIFVVAETLETPRMDLPRDMLEQRARHQLLDFVLVHHDRNNERATAARWLEAIPANRHFHLRKGRVDDWSRLANVISGHSVGLVLSGGGARAFAHLGAVRALIEAGVPIDFVGGTSMGAIIAAGLALEWGVDELAERIEDSFVRKNPLSDYALPIVGLVKGKRVEALLHEHFGDIEIPDLWRPYYCVSSNLTNARAYVHRRGRLCDALRATIALPGILPPVITESGVLADGAVISNLPVSAMKRLNRGTIVAVDVARDLAIEPGDFTQDVLAGSWVKKLSRPPIVSLLIRAGTVSSEETDRAQAQYADLVLAPKLGQIEIRDWQSFDKAVAIGYEHTRERLTDPEVLSRIIR